MKKLIVTMAAAITLSGCISTDWMGLTDDKDANAGTGQLNADQEVVYIETARVDMLGERGSRQPGNTFVDDNNFQTLGGDLPMINTNVIGANRNRAYGKALVKNINHFVRGIMHDLVDNIHYINDKTPIGVASFIFLDRSFKESSLLGNQIAESFMHEVHQFGIPVIDFKTTDYLRVTNHGDFVFSRDFLELKDELPIKYVLAGTLVKHQSGYLVNARIIGLTSKAIVASAQGFIPNAVAEAIMPSQHNDGISLSQGE
jgi:TolB-like protein